MDKIISISNMSFSYDNKKIFDNFNLDIKKGEYVSLIGLNGAGKSTLVRILLGLIKVKGCITIDDIELSKTNKKDILSKIGVVFENPDNQFVASTVMDDIAFSLENMHIPANQIENKVKEIATKLEIVDLLDKEPHKLSGGQKQLVALASALVKEPKILLLDESFTMIDSDSKDKLYNIIKKINKKDKITIINVTHDIEDVLYGGRIVVLDKGTIKLDGKTETVLKKDKELTKLGFPLPFMVDLSIKLKYYGLIDKIIYDMDEMVDILWK